MGQFKAIEKEYLLPLAQACEGGAVEPILVNVKANGAPGPWQVLAFPQFYLYHALSLSPSNNLFLSRVRMLLLKCFRTCVTFV